jgi:hypothetical protein
LIDAMTALDAWRNFYVIVGSSAGALIGLQFVVMTLIANTPLARGNAQAGDTFTTPTVIHFGVVLLLSAARSAPWDGIAAVAALWGLVPEWHQMGRFRELGAFLFCAPPEPNNK